MNPQIRDLFQSLKKQQIDGYSSYWGDLTVKDDATYFRRWLFAFCSVHTTWESNVKGYNGIQDYEPWLDDKEDLRRRLIVSRCGLHNNRTNFIYEFSQKFWADPQWYYRGKDEPWWMCRDRLAGAIKGLGLAKTTFALEMSFPLEADIVCLDIHMLRLYGDEKAGPNHVKYHAFEDDWVGRSEKAGVSPYIARNVFWDKMQGQPDSRYWSHVLETKPQEQT